MSIISTNSMQKCWELIGKVRELRFLKGRERQISKINRLLQKKGNITWLSTPSNPNSHQPGRCMGSVSDNPLSKLGRSAGTQPQAASANPQQKRSAGNAGTHSQAGSANPPLSQEEVQAGISLIPRQARVSVPVKSSLAL